MKSLKWGTLSNQVKVSLQSVTRRKFFFLQVIFSFLKIGLVALHNWGLTPERRQTWVARKNALRGGSRWTFQNSYFTVGKEICIIVPRFSVAITECRSKLFGGLPYRFSSLKRGYCGILISQALSPFSSANCKKFWVIGLLFAKMLSSFDLHWIVLRSSSDSLSFQTSKSVLQLGINKAQQSKVQHENFIKKFRLLSSSTLKQTDLMPYGDTHFKPKLWGDKTLIFLLVLSWIVLLSLSDLQLWCWWGLKSIYELLDAWGLKNPSSEREKCTWYVKL